MLIASFILGQSTLPYERKASRVFAHALLRGNARGHAVLLP